MTTSEQIPALLDELEARYDASVQRLRTALLAYVRDGVRPDPKERDDGAFAYPELRIEYDPETPQPTPARGVAPGNKNPH